MIYLLYLIIVIILLLKNISKEQSKVLVRIFTDLMNKKALEAGCTNTHFVTPNGLDASDENGIHQTTAYDLSVMMSYCIKNPDFIEITKAVPTALAILMVKDILLLMQMHSYPCMII